MCKHLWTLKTQTSLCSWQAVQSICCSNTCGMDLKENMKTLTRLHRCTGLFESWLLSNTLSDLLPDAAHFYCFQDCPKLIQLNSINPNTMLVFIPHSSHYLMMKQNHLLSPYLLQQCLVSWPGYLFWILSCKLTFQKL